MSKHTPGPWTSNSARDIKQKPVRTVRQAEFIIRNLLDALLELHAACEFWEDQEDPVLASAREAIAKAKGEGTA